MQPTISGRRRWNDAPRGVIACALLFWAVGAYLLATALLVGVGAAPFTTGAWLLGGMETMGPGIYVIVALVAITIGAGLLYTQNWARHLASVAAGVVFVLTIPTISSAVAYSRTPAIVREGLKIIVCVVLFRYLTLRETTEAFTHPADSG
jgi:Na+-transporting NADH:ubiquinone oxidoreductase subunit NqrB